MTYKLVFKAVAKKEWDKLDTGIRRQFKKKLAQRLDMPRVESARLNGMQNCYKIKLRGAGYRLVYRVRDNDLVVSAATVGKRERNAAYKAAVKRI